MAEWIKALEAKARIILGQLLEARKLAVEAGLDPDEVSQPYLDLIKDLYLDACQAQLADDARGQTVRDVVPTVARSAAVPGPRATRTLG